MTETFQCFYLNDDAFLDEKIDPIQPDTLSFVQNPAVHLFVKRQAALLETNGHRPLIKFLLMAGPNFIEGIETSANNLITERRMQQGVIRSHT